MAEKQFSTGNWEEREVKHLISIWAEDAIQGKLQGCVRNLTVFTEISHRRAAIGIKRSAIQCREKLKKLKATFRQTEDHNRKSGADRRECAYYDLLAPILKDRPEMNPHHVTCSGK